MQVKDILKKLNEDNHVDARKFKHGITRESIAEFINTSDYFKRLITCLNLFLKIENTDQMIMPFKIVHWYTNQPSDCMPNKRHSVPMLVLGKITDNGTCTSWAIRMPLFQVPNANEYRISIYFQEDIVLDEGSNIWMTPEQVDDQGRDVTYFYPKNIADFIENPEKYLSRQQIEARID
jgi:hypothetical protein